MSGFDPLRTLASYWKLCETHRGAPMFRLFKLNPPNDWNVVGWEIAIVVFGVLIALGAQQVVDTLRWRDEVRRTEDALTIEIAASVLHASERQLVNRCLSDRLTHLIGKVSSNQGPWSGDPMPINKSPHTVTTVSAAPY